MEAHKDPPFHLNKVVSDDAWAGLSARMIIKNTTSRKMQIPYDGDTSQLPKITVPPAYVAVDRLVDDEWVDITPLSEGVAVIHVIQPGEHVEFDARLPHNLDVGATLRVRVGDITSESFQIGEMEVEERE